MQVTTDYRLQVSAFAKFCFGKISESGNLKPATNIAIIGLGLIGGSLAAALKTSKQHKKYFIIGYDSNKSHMDTAFKKGIINKKAKKLTDAVKSADIIILCTPISSFASIIKQIAPQLKKGAIISDTASVKHSVINEILPLLDKEQKKCFVPSHPIAGSEKSGISASNARLFNNKPLFICKHRGLKKTASASIAQLWQDAGANIEYINARKHDKIYAIVSHTPQFLSFCYADFLASNGANRQKINKMTKNNANFKEFMRLVSSNQAIWQDIFAYNAKNIVNCLKKVQKALILDKKSGNNTQNDIKTQEYTLFTYLPSRLAAIIATMAAKTNVTEYAGSGFASFTAPARQQALSSACYSFACVKGFAQKIKTLSPRLL